MISICICTFKRPVLLKNLLDKIYSKSFERPPHDLEIIIADNDPLHSAREVIEIFRSRTDIQLKMIHVASPNIAAARNAAIHETQGELLAFIDDDEIPCNEWLVKMHCTMLDTGADVVFGPVVPSLHEKSPNWINTGRYFERERFPTGTSIDLGEARTGNVLINRKSVLSMEGPFNLDFGRTGGEDTLFFKQLLKLGTKFSWCDEAVVEETVPLERASARWLIMRSFRIGQTWIRTEMYQLHGRKKLSHWFFLLLKSFAQFFIASLVTVLALPFSRQISFRWLRTCSSQFGKVTSLAGHQFQEYGH